MIDAQTLLKLVQKGFPMVGNSPTIDELEAALNPWEHTVFCPTSAQKRGSIKQIVGNKMISTSIEDTFMDNILARLWLIVN